MCGILGELAFDAREAAAAAPRLRELTGLLARRGPDGEGFWTDGESASLGFRRLAVLDVSPRADQPMLTADERYALVYNGEIYNFRELRHELEHSGLRFRSSGDTEVVLHALAHWGRAALPRFQGMFALAFYDRQRKSLLLARDPMGIKPLYTLLGARGLLFASQYDVLLAHPWSRELALSHEALGFYLRLGDIPAPYAALEGTQMLAPGHWQSVDREGSEGGPFFTFDREAVPDLFGAEADEAVHEALASAVRRQLVSDVPVGAFLSGGVDSPLVAAAARAAGADPLPAYTLSTEGDDFDETDAAVAYAQELQVPHHPVLLRAADAAKLLDQAIAACAEPFIPHALFPILTVAGAARSQIKVALSGDGGDELFWGYTSRAVPILSRLLPSQGQTALGKLFHAAPGTDRTAWPQSVGDIYRIKQTRGCEGLLRGLFPELPAWPQDFTLFDYEGMEPGAVARWLRWNDLSGTLPGILLKMDRGSMAHGIEVRVPLLDPEVVAVAARVDWSSCLDLAKDVGKLPLRRSLARYVSKQTRRKRGFGFDDAGWLAGPLASAVEDALLGRRELAGMPFASERAGDLLKRLRAGENEYAWILWVLLGLALWEDRHYRSASSQQLRARA